MNLNNKFFNWAEQRSRDVAYGVNLDKECLNPFEPIIDAFAMVVAFPRLARRYFVQKYSS